MKKSILAMLFLAAVILLVSRRAPVRPPPHTHGEVKVHSAMVHAASLLFRQMYGSFPSGSLAQVYQALAGTNQKNIVFLELSPDEVSTNGCLLDPWGEQYQIEFREPDGVIVRSAGRDGTWGTPDDMENQWGAQQPPPR